MTRGSAFSTTVTSTHTAGSPAPSRPILGSPCPGRRSEQPRGSRRPAAAAPRAPGSAAQAVPGLEQAHRSAAPTASGKFPGPPASPCAVTCGSARQGRLRSPTYDLRDSDSNSTEPSGASRPPPPLPAPLRRLRLSPPSSPLPPAPLRSFLSRTRKRDRRTWGLAGRALSAPADPVHACVHGDGTDTSLVASALSPGGLRAPTAAQRGAHPVAGVGGGCSRWGRGSDPNVARGAARAHAGASAQH